MDVQIRKAVCLIAGGLALGGGWQPAAAGEADPHAKQLRAVGISPDLPGVVGYLNSLHPDEAHRRRVAGLIAALGSSNYFERESAMRELVRTAAPPVEELRRAAAGKDPEVAWRAKAILKVTGPRNARILYSVLQTIERRGLKGATAAVLGAIPLCQERHLLYAARQALLATAKPQDAPLLRESLANDHQTEIRRAAAAALGSVLGDGCTDDLLVLMGDPDPWVRFEAARALGNIGDRRSLDVLGDLLSADDVRLRAEAAAVLRHLTGQQIAYIAYEQPDVRIEQASHWRKWIADAGKTAPLRFPLAEHSAVELGRTVICLYSEHRVVEVDMSGKQVLEIRGYRGPWGAQRLPNGNLLVNWYDSGCVVEYDPSGKEVWKKDDLNYPWSAQRLEGGNTLVALTGGAVEIDQSGKEVWSVELSGTCGHARRLPGGNTLVVLVTAGKVVEIDRDGKAVWEIEGLNQPYRAQRLPGGNTIVAEYGRRRVVEFDSTGKNVVWSKEELNYPDGVQRLTNGNTLVSDSSGVHEIARDGSVIWQQTVSRNLAFRY